MIRNKSKEGIACSVKFSSLRDAITVQFAIGAFSIWTITATGLITVLALKTESASCSCCFIY